MSRLFNFISWIWSIAVFIVLLLIVTGHLSEDFTLPILFVMLFINWVQILFRWRKKKQPLGKMDIFELIFIPIALIVSLYNFWVQMPQ